MHIQWSLTCWVFWGLGGVFHYYLFFWDCFSLLVTLCFGSFQSLVGDSGWGQVKSEKITEEGFRYLVINWRDWICNDTVCLNFEVLFRTSKRGLSFIVPF